MRHAPIHVLRANEVPSGLAVAAVTPGIIHTEMLESCDGESANTFESPETWAKKAAPMLLGLGPNDNGASLSI